MFFSIIIPIYNSEKTIERCLESIKKQTFGDFEAILIDDGSIDSSVKVCQEFIRNDERFILYTWGNKGVSTTRNYGLTIAKGKYIAFLDSDDVYFPDYLMTFYKMVCHNPEIDNFWCGFQYIASNNNQNGEKCIFSTEEELSIVDRNIIMSLHEKTLDAALWNKIYKKEIIDKQWLRMKEGLSLGEDLLFNYAYLNSSGSKIMICNKALYGYYNGSANSLNNKYRKELKSIYDELNSKMQRYIKIWNVQEEQKRKFYSSKYYSLNKVLYNTFRHENGMSNKEKYAYNHEIMHSEEFKEAVKQADCFIHPLYRLAYKSEQFRVVQIMDWLVKVKEFLYK